MREIQQNKEVKTEESKEEEKIDDLEIQVRVQQERLQALNEETYFYYYRF
jgi:hypothetical protein